MKYIVTHFGEHDLSWIYENTDDFLIYNRTGQELPNSVSRENIGDADFDRLSYIVDNYYELPDVFLLSKSNLFKYISKEEFDVLKNNEVFTPLLTQNHKTYSDERGKSVCYYENNMYHEVNNSWYLREVPAKSFDSWRDWSKEFFLPNPEYIPFAPGGNYILTRETVHRWPKEYYDRMRSFLPYCERPGESQLVERSLFLLWR